MMEITTGAAAGVLAATSTEILHDDPSQRTHESYLEELCVLTTQMVDYLSKTPQNKPDHRVTQLLQPNVNTPLFYHEYLGLYLLIPVAATFNVTVSGLPPFQIQFATAPTSGQFPIGIFKRWRYSDGTFISLTTPTNNNFPIELLYTDDLSD